MKKGDSIQFYYYSNHFIIKDSSFKNDNFIEYPDNIISTTILIQMILNNNKYDISFLNKYNNIINYLSTSSFHFIKNQNYIINQSDISNYNPTINTNNNFYIKINNNFDFEIYNDSTYF